MSWLENTVSIVIPTYKRPEGISRVLKSVEAETVTGYNIEIVIADNDPAGSAGDFVKSFAAKSQAKIIYTHVPEPGVSNARNGALAVASGRYILFIDDDMEALKGWAEAMVLGAVSYNATLAFGPVDAVMPETGHALYDYMQPLFCRNRDLDDGYMDEGVATGNCFLDRGIAKLPTPVFDPALNQTGGEDDALFAHLIEHGAKIAWLTRGKTLEYVPAHRATLKYVWQRNFAWGQGPTQHEADKGLKGLPGIVKWMAVGLFQILLYALRWSIAKLFGRPEAIQHWGRLAQGVGKVVWSERLSPKLYGI